MTKTLNFYYFNLLLKITCWEENYCMAHICWVLNSTFCDATLAKSTIMQQDWKTNLSSRYQEFNPLGMLVKTPIRVNPLAYGFSLVLPPSPYCLCTKLACMAPLSVKRTLNLSTSIIRKLRRSLFREPPPPPSCKEKMIYLYYLLVT